MRSTLFRKLLLSSLLLIAVTLVALDFYLTPYTRRHQTEAIETLLTGKARILAGEITSGGGADLKQWANSVGTRARARITVIDGRGVVLADSQHDAESMENHAGRPEVRAAAAGRVGASIRHSATLGVDLCYVAFPLDDAARPGWVLRLAVPLGELDAAISAVRRQVLAASVVAAGVALVIAWFFSRSFTRRVRRLQSFAERLLDEDAPPKLAIDSSDELGALAGSLSRMAARLHDLVDRLSLESGQRQSILASMVEGVLAVDEQLRVTFYNDAFARAAGAGVIARQAPLWEVLRDHALVDMLRDVLTRGEPRMGRLELAARGHRTYEVQATRLATPATRGALAILHDITDLERLERVRKDFVANVSHELRTPLTAIQGYSETLLDGALEDPVNNRRFVEIIQAHAVRLNNIASDLLALSDLESNQAMPEPEPILLADVLDAARRTVEPEARVRKVTLIAGPVVEARVLAHTTRLEQVFVNLLSNAIKFNRPGGEVRIETTKTDGLVNIAIADTGIGIPSEELPRIFERFYRVDKARSRAVGGTGLGLSIVKHAVERMNGTIRAESQFGKGSRFTVQLPVWRAES